MKPHNRQNNRVVLVASLAIGLASIGLGSWSLSGLTASFQPEDILHDDGPELFRVWLERYSVAGTITPQSIGRRLLAMPIASRRATADALMQHAFKEAIAGRESERRAFLKTLELGLVEALKAAPSSGELWLAASKIRAMHHGFDARAEAYLSMSYLAAPREAAVARSRLVFAASVSPLLRSSFAEERARDLDTVAAVFPEFERRYRDWLESGNDETGSKRRSTQAGLRQ